MEKWWLNYYGLIVTLFVSQWVNLSNGQNDTECRRDMHSHMACMARQHEENKIADEETIQQAQEQITKCFTNVDCSPPDFILFHNQNSAHFRHRFNFTKQKADIPEVVRQCMKESKRNEGMEKLNQCLQQAGVRQLPQGHDHPHFENPQNHTSDGFREFIMQRMLITRAIVECKQDIGDDEAMDVARCAHQIRSQVKMVLCPRLKLCELEKVRPGCQERGQQIRHALCKCRKQRLTETIENIDKLIGIGQSVDHRHLLDALGELEDNHHKEQLQEIKRCYKLNGLKFLENEFRGTENNHDSPVAKFLDDRTSTVSVQQLNNIKVMLKVKQLEEVCDQCS